MIGFKRVPDDQGHEAAARGTVDQRKFDVFISYSRRDAAFARRLQRALSSYLPPRDLPVPQRRLRVFRDESDFQGGEYGSALAAMLQSAATLLVICSPNSRASQYVGDEIARFSALRGKEHIICALNRGSSIAGIPVRLHRRLPTSLVGTNLQRSSRSVRTCDGARLAALANSW